MTTRTPIAYADPTGFVTTPILNGTISEQAATNLLTPLYSQDEIDASMAKFYLAQGLNADGTDVIPSVTTSLDEEAAAVEAAATDRAVYGKNNTGVSIAEAAIAAMESFGLPDNKKAKK